MDTSRITLIYLPLRKMKKKNGNKVRHDPHKIANRVPNALIAHFVMFYK